MGIVHILNSNSGNAIAYVKLRSENKKNNPFGLKI